MTEEDGFVGIDFVDNVLKTMANHALINPAPWWDRWFCCDHDHMVKLGLTSTERGDPKELWVCPVCGHKEKRQWENS